MLQHIGRYRVERMLGSGAFATVYMATDEALDATVAVKVLAENWAHDEDIRRRFSEEARILWRLDSDHIVRVHTVDQLPDGRPYFVMDYADAGTLADRMRDRRAGGGSYSVDDAMRLSSDIADGLAVAHRQGIVHRDLKPSNVLFRTSSGRGVRLVLADFGIARSLESARGSTIAAGTPHYMAPEQAQGQADRPSDVYAAAVILHELLVGDCPFPFDSAGQVLRAQLTETPADVRIRRPDVPAPIAELISRGLALEPSHRPADGTAWKAALTAAAAGHDVAPGQGATLGPGDIDRAGATLGPSDLPAPAPPPAYTPPAPTPPAYTPPPPTPPPPTPPPYTPPPATPPISPPPYPPPGGPTPTPVPMSGPSDQDKRRRSLFLVGAVVVVVALIAGAMVFSSNKASAGEIILAPKNAPGAHPFTPSVVPASATTPAFTPPTVPAQQNGATGSVSGSTAGLYGGTKQLGVCDPGQLVSFLQANPAKGRAWATVLGITPDQIPAYVGGLTPVVLRTDTRVTNHGFVNGTANPIQSVLQAGTAVLVDAYGVPRVKCYCGNPLTEPKAVTGKPTYTGEKWPGFSAPQIIVIAPTIKIDTLVLVDVANGQPFVRPLGTSGAADTAAPAGIALFGAGGQLPTAATGPDPFTPPTPAPTAPPASPVSISSEGSVSATSTYSGQFPVSAGVDGNVRTSWFSAGARDGNTTTYTWTGQRDDRITDVVIVGNAQNSDPANRRGFGYGSVEIQVIDGAGNVVYDQGFSGPSTAVNEVHATPNAVGRRVVLKLSGRESSDCGGFGELNIVAAR
jgi:serine/threonine protein kinase